MPRSAGVTTSSAVIVFIGSAFSILCGAMMVLVSVFSMYSSREAESAGLNLHYILAIGSVLFFGFGGWGVAAGIVLWFWSLSGMRSIPLRRNPERRRVEIGSG
jgi:hypothetical protein